MFDSFLFVLYINKKVFGVNVQLILLLFLQDMFYLEKKMAI